MNALWLPLTGWIALCCWQEPDKTPPASAPSSEETKIIRPIPKPQPAKPLPPKALDDAILKGINYLLQHQNGDGSFGTAELTKALNIYAPVPGAHDAFRAAVTSMCITALIETGDPRSEVREAIERAEKWLMDELPKVKRATPDAIYNVWAHAYSIQALAKMYTRIPDDQERQKKIGDLIRMQFDFLDRFESVDGGWGYYDFKIGSKKPAVDSTPFTTAAVLVAFKDAKNIGFEPPEKLVQRGVASIVRQRLPDFSYLYGEYLKWVPQHGINKPGGSLGRSQSCNVALRLWGDNKVTNEVIMNWLNRLITNNIWLDIGRKRPVPHESYYAVAGYFYYFGHYYAALCIEQLPAQKRAFYQNHLAAIIMSKQEQNGCWWDYPLYNYHFCYGTAFALMTLQRCKNVENSPPATKGK